MSFSKIEYSSKGFSGKDANIDEKITEFDTEGRLKQITNHVKIWEMLSFEDRQAVVDTLIKVIRIADGNIEITWNI